MKNRTHYNKAIRLLGIYRVNSNPYFHAWAYDGGLWPDGRKRIVARCTKETELAKARKAAAKFVLELNRKNP